MRLIQFAAMGQLGVHYWAAELWAGCKDPKDQRKAIKLKTLGLVVHDRVLNGRPISRH